MKTVWIIDPYNEVPEKGWRDGRYFIIAKLLSENGYSVNFFISNFSHRSKKKVNDVGIIRFNANLNIVVVPSITYYKHISLRRIRYERIFAKNVVRNQHDLPLPDILIMKEPAVFMFDEILKLILKSNCRLVLDVMDLWPELFEIKLPHKLKTISRIIFYPLYYKRKKIFLKASAITAVSPDYLEVATKVNNKVPNMVVYWGGDTKAISSSIESKITLDLHRLGLYDKKQEDVWGIYAGTLGENYDISTLLAASAYLNNKISNLKIIIAGTGPLENIVKKFADENQNIIFIGSLPTEQLYKLFGFCDFGFSTYAKGSTVSMPIKCFDYLAAGLPIVNSLNRNLGVLVREFKIGYQYEATNYLSLTNALTKLMEDRSELVDMKQRCLDLSKTFDNSIQYKQFLSLLENL